MKMKKQKGELFMHFFVLLVVAICVSSVSADITGDCETNYDEVSQKLHVKVTLTGGEEGAQASEYPLDFVILIDSSLSTKDVHEGKTRLEWAKNATAAFLEALYAHNSAVGVVTFSDDATEVSPLNSNFEEVKRSLEKVSSHGFSTNYGEGVQKAAFVLKGRGRESIPIIIILTDGGEDDGVTNVEDAIDFAMKEGIIIHVVSYGDIGWIDEVMLREKVVKPSGGEYKYSDLERLSESLVETINSEEFLSAANLRIIISQCDEAVLDHLSIEEMVKPSVALTKKGYFEFVSPKLTPGQKIDLEFDSFTTKKGVNVTAGVVDVYYTGQEGRDENTSISAKYNVPPPPPPPIDGVPLIYVIGSLIGVAFLSFVIGVRIGGKEE